MTVIDGSKYYSEVNGEPVVSAAGVAVLMGRQVEEVKQLVSGSGRQDIARIPDEWVQAGRRRQEEYRAATGRDDMVGAIHYFIQKEGLR